MAALCFATATPYEARAVTGGFSGVAAPRPRARRLGDG
jgi:hypothetical protein